MAKFVIDAALDAALNYIKTNATRQDLCSQQPTTRTEAITTYTLGNIVVDSTDFTGPTDGDTNGRKLTMNQQTGVAITGDGTVNHVAVTSATELLLVTTCTAQVVTNGNTATVNAFDHEIADAA